MQGWRRDRVRRRLADDDPVHRAGRPRQGDGDFRLRGLGGGSIGVLLGGILTNSLDWHWIFLVNVPVGILVFALTLSLVPGQRGIATDRRIDIAGAFTVTASLILAVYAIVNGNQEGWTSAQTSSRRGRRLLAVFLGIESRVANPLVPLRPSLRNVSVANVVGVPLGGRHVRVALPLGALPPAGAGVQPSRWASRSCPAT